MVDEHAGDQYLLSSVIDAALTPPFLTDRRVVVASDIGRFTADDFAGLVAYLADPMPSTDLVLTSSGGRLPKRFTDAWKKAGGQNIDVDPPTRARERQGWFDEQFAAAGLKLDAAAKARIIDVLGEDVGRLGGVLDALAASYSGRLGVAEVEPFLGQAGAVPPWELTDAIDRGDTAVALDRLQRLVVGGERHPLQIMSTLHGHYGRMLRLDGSGAEDETTAAQVLGLKSTFPAQKALAQLRRLGPTGVRRAVELLAAADLDLRGAVDWPAELVVELLVARLSKLGPAARRR
jgi:DNA polymerase-3 subunit delta